MRNHKWVLITLIVLIVIPTYGCSIAAPAISSSATNDWTTFRQNSDHTGYTMGNNQSDFVKLLWNYTTGRMVQSSPAVSNGLVFVGSRDSQLFCLNASNGQDVWKFSFHREVWSSPAVYNGAIFVGVDDGYLYCLNVTSGIPIWRSEVGGLVRSSPVIVDDRVYIGSGNQGVFCFNATNGKTIWNHSTSCRVDSSPAVSEGILYVATDDFCIYALNASTGNPIWSRHTGSTISSPSVYDGYVYIGSYDGYVCGLNASNGDQIWKYQTQDAVESSPAVAYGYVYVGSDDNNLYCLNASSGQKIWQSPTGFWITSSPAISGGNVYVGSEDFNIYCFNASTGTKEWSYATENFVESSPTIVNNTLYIGSDDKNIYALTLNDSTAKSMPSQTTNLFSWTTTAFEAIAFFTVGITIFIIAKTVHTIKRTKQTQSTDNFSKNFSQYLVSKDAIFILAILAFSIIFYINLAGGNLWTADEQTYSQWAFHMIKTGDYMTPWAFGDLSFWIAKPPLNMWLMALSYQAFGVSNITSRLPSAIFGSLSLVLVFYLGKKLYNSSVGFLSAIILGTFTTYYAFATHAMTDVPFVFFIIASIYFFIVSQKTEKPNRYTVLSGLFFGFALMTKQLEALILPLIMFTYLLATKRSIRFFFTKQFTLFWGVGLLLFSPWLIDMGISFGPQFWHYYFFYSAVTRTISPIEGHAESYLFYFNYLANKEMWWSILLPFGIGLCGFKAIFKHSKADSLIILWLSLVLLVFTLAQTKLYWYILPAFPAFAIAISSFLSQLTEKIKSRIITLYKPSKLNA